MKTKMDYAVIHKKSYLKFTAYIPKSKKHNIPRTLQKSWKARCDHKILEHEKEQVKAAFMAEATRWHAKMMAKFFPSAKHPEHLTQTYITQ